MPAACLLELAKAPAAVHEHSGPIGPGSGIHSMPVNSMLCASTVRPQYAMPVTSADVVDAFCTPNCSPREKSGCLQL